MQEPPRQLPSDPQLILGAISWVLLIAVMFGGEALLRMLSTGQELSAHEEQFFRAGHGHAGVLAIIGILYSNYLGKTLLSVRAQVVSWSLYALGVFMLSGGMFLYAYTGDAGAISAGSYLSAAGGVVIAGTVMYLAWNLFRARGGAR